MGRTNNDTTAVNLKYSDEVLEYGWVAIPNLLMQYQGRLNLNDGELVTYIRLLTFWFYKHSEVRPSIALLASYGNVGTTTIAGHLRSLEKKGFIKRNLRPGLVTLYDVKPGISILYKFQKAQLSQVNPDKISRGYQQIFEPPPPQVSDSKEYQALKRPKVKKTNPHSLKEIIQEFNIEL